MSSLLADVNWVIVILKYMDKKKKQINENIINYIVPDWYSLRYNIAISNVP